ncbi:MAG: acyltransferase, partial [Pseudomonadota bacterium]
ADQPPGQREKHLNREIGGILLNSKGEDLPRFYYNRATRIWIPYFFAVVLFYSVSTLKDPIDAVWLEYLFYDLTFTHNWFVPMLVDAGLAAPLEGTGNHFWSISVEEQFYLVAPLIIIFFRFGRSLAPWAALAAFGLATGYYASVCVGVLLAVLRRDYGDWHEAAPARLAIAAAALATGAGLYLARGHYGLIAPVFSGAVVLLTAVRGERSRWGSFAGGISYPFYLNHWIGIFVAHEVAQALTMEGHPTMIALGYVLNLGVASALYIAIDQQIQRRRGGYFTAGRGAMLAVIAYALIVAGVLGGVAMRFVLP